MKVRNWFIRTTYPNGRVVTTGVKKHEFNQTAHQLGFVYGQETFSLKVLHNDYVTAPEGTLIEGFSEEVEHCLPTIIPMEPLPAESNPFHYDLFNMGCEVSGPWMAMYSEHAGRKQEHNKTDDEAGKPVWYRDPEYIILVNQRTGQRFRIDFTKKEQTCSFCKAVIEKRADDLWHDSKDSLSQYCYVDPAEGSKLHLPRTSQSPQRAQPFQLGAPDEA